MLEDEIGRLNPNEWKPFWTDGSWSLHHLLEYVLEQTGKADVYISSFSISEASIRMLYNLIDSGAIMKLKCLFDIRTKKDKLDLLLFANGITPLIFLANCHAKIVIIENDKWKIAILTSANFTVNKRFETGVICSIPNIVEFYKNNFEAAIETAAPLFFEE